MPKLKCLQIQYSSTKIYISQKDQTPWQSEQDCCWHSVSPSEILGAAVQCAGTTAGQESQCGTEILMEISHSVTSTNPTVTIFKILSQTKVECAQRPHIPRSRTEILHSKVTYSTAW